MLRNPIASPEKLDDTDESMMNHVPSVPPPSNPFSSSSSSTSYSRRSTSIIRNTNNSGNSLYSTGNDSIEIMKTVSFAENSSSSTIPSHHLSSSASSSSSSYPVVSSSSQGQSTSHGSSSSSSLPYNRISASISRSTTGALRTAASTLSSSSPSSTVNPSSAFPVSPPKPPVVSSSSSSSFSSASQPFQPSSSTFSRMMREPSEARSDSRSFRGSVSLSRSVMGGPTSSSSSSHPMVSSTLPTSTSILGVLSPEERKEAETLSVYEYAERIYQRNQLNETKPVPAPLLKRISRIASSDNVSFLTSATVLPPSTASSSIVNLANNPTDQATAKPVRSFGLSGLRANQSIGAASIRPPVPTSSTLDEGPPLRLLNQWEQMLKEITVKNQHIESFQKLQEEQTHQAQTQSVLMNELTKQLSSFDTLQQQQLQSPIKVRYNWQTQRMQQLRKDTKIQQLQQQQQQNSSSSTITTPGNSTNDKRMTELQHLIAPLQILQKHGNKLGVRLKSGTDGTPKYEVRELTNDPTDSSLQPGEIMVFGPPSGHALYTLLNKYVDTSEKLAINDAEIAINLMQKIPYIEASNEEMKNPGSLAGSTNPDVRSVQEARTLAGESRHTALVWSLIRTLWGRTPSECSQEPGNRIGAVLGSDTANLQPGTLITNTVTTNNLSTTAEKRPYSSMDMNENHTQRRRNSSSSSSPLYASVLKTIRTMIDDTNLVHTAYTTVQNNEYTKSQGQLYRREKFSQWLQNTLAYYPSRGYVLSGTGSGTNYHIQSHQPISFSSPLTNIHPLPLPCPLTLQSLQTYPDYTYKQVYEGILSALARRDLRQAKELAFATGHPMLGLLVSSAGTDIVGRSTLQKQLQQWNDTNGNGGSHTHTNTSSSSSSMSNHLLGIYSVLAGDPWDKTVRSVHRPWLECLGLCHWYTCEPIQSLEMTIQYFIRNISVGVASVPLPWYTGKENIWMQRLSATSATEVSTHGIATAHPYITAPSLSRNEELALYAEYAGIDKHHTEKVAQLQLEEILQLHEQQNLPNIHEHVTNIVDQPLIVNSSLVASNKLNNTAKGPVKNTNDLVPQLDKIPSALNVQFISDNDHQRWAVQPVRDTLYRLMQYATMNETVPLTNDPAIVRDQILSPLGHTTANDEGCLPFHLLYILSSLASFAHQERLQQEAVQDKEFIDTLVRTALQQIHQEYQTKKSTQPLLQHPYVSNGNYDYLLTDTVREAIVDLLHRKFYDTVPHSLIIPSPPEIQEWARIYAVQLENKGAWHYSIVVYQCAAGLLANRLLPSSPDHPVLSASPTPEEVQLYQEEITSISDALRTCLAFANNLLHVYSPKPKLIMETAVNYVSLYGTGGTGNSSSSFTGATDAMLTIPSVPLSSASSRLATTYEYLQRIEWLMNESFIPNTWMVHALAASAAGVSSLWGTKILYDEEQYENRRAYEIYKEQQEQQGLPVEPYIMDTNNSANDSLVYAPPLPHQLNAQLAVPTLYYLSKLSADEILTIDGLYKFPSGYNENEFGLPRVDYWSITTFRALMERDILPRFLLHHLETTILTKATNKAYQTNHVPYVQSLKFPVGLCCGNVMDDFGSNDARNATNAGTKSGKVSVGFPGIVTDTAWNYEQMYHCIQYLLKFGTTDNHQSMYLTKIIHDGYFRYLTLRYQDSDNIDMNDSSNDNNSHSNVTNLSSGSTNDLTSEDIVRMVQYFSTQVRDEENPCPATDTRYWPSCPMNRNNDTEQEPYADHVWPLTQDKRKYLRSFLLAIADLHRSATD